MVFIQRPAPQAQLVLWTRSSLQTLENVQGRIAPPLILWMLGVPSSVCVAVWFFFFRS